ncbi:MAG: two-component system, sensor histidine kinase [Desulfovibrionales bacterium]|nr:two-component system, sensor histidine kinase [Desulfovibrionales bacterium]
MLLPSKSDRLERLMASRVNELLRQNQQLEQAVRARDTFLATLSHDLRSPLTGQLALMTALLERMDGMDPAKIREMVESMHASSVNLYNLLENLLQWTALRNGEVGLTASKVEIEPAAAAAMRLHQPSAAQKNIRLSCDISEEIAAFADRRVVETVLRNLISNAVKFTPPGGVVRISSVESGYKVKLTVSDTGPGMDRSRLQSINLGGYAQSGLGSIGESGAGLGLVLCNELLSKYGGRLSVENAPDHGCSFSFHLPKA